MNDPTYRQAAFSWLADQVRIHGDVLPRDLLTTGFEFNGERISFLGPQGIWKPKVFPEIPLSIVTKIDSPYNDGPSDDGFLLYRYQGNNPDQWDNAGLRKAMRQQVPLIYFYNVVKGHYLAIWPVYVVGDDIENLTFTVAADDVKFMYSDNGLIVPLKFQDVAVQTIRRSYITTNVRVRLHQTAFREQVIAAYHEQCALCRLRHRELLDAAHIIPDTDPLGVPEVFNGLSLCKLHHAAFDGCFVGVRPDYTIEVREDILREKDGPMLVHGLQNLHNGKIILPGSKKQQPDRDLLEIRYQRFKAAG